MLHFPRRRAETFTQADLVPVLSKHLPSLQRLAVNYHRNHEETLQMKDIAVSVYEQLFSLRHLELSFLPPRKDRWGGPLERGVYEANRSIAVPELLVRSHIQRSEEPVNQNLRNVGLPIPYDFSGWVKDPPSSVTFKRRTEFQKKVAAMRHLQSR
jgi:hypothetical protein